MLFNLIETKRGKDTVIMTDQLKVVNKRKATLIASLRGKNIQFKVVPADTNVKFSRKPHDGSWREGKSATPKRIK